MRRAQLIKNVRLKSVVELFTDADSGIGQFDIEDLSKEFQWDVADPPNDLILIRKLVLLPSYDDYSLRISLRDMGVNIESVDNLKLPDSKNKELSSYMTHFTCPLINHIYGSDKIDI
ncbi:MAG: hypothetical protein QMB78_00315 [Rhodospirillales bacterium]